MPSRNIIESWLKTLVSYDIPPDELADRLIHLGLEVEGVDDRREKLKGFIVGEVLTKASHENADKLSVCTVSVGSGEPLNVVCGAPNVAAGQKIAFAPVGTEIPGAGFAIEKRKIRGVLSEGMICSEKELGLGDSHEGILVLDEHLSPGTPLSEIFGDVIYEVEVTPNRGDCLSHLGVAREIAALVGRTVTLPDADPVEGEENAAEAISVSIAEPELCPRYAARVVKGVVPAPSPLWLQDRLNKLGVRPRNNVVDIAAYVMFECGHPLHAFDYDLIKGNRIEVRKSQGGESFTTLDGKERELPEDALMICDAERPVAIAGVMGGANSEIGDGTVNVLIESAWFNPSSVRKTAKRLGLSTDASYRFERGADIDIVEYAVNRAAAMIAEIAGGTVLRGVVDEYPVRREPLRIPLRFGRTNEILGLEIPADRQISLLESIGFAAAEKEENSAVVTVPSWRTDVGLEVDLIEEIARLNDYANIPDDPRATVSFDLSADPLQKLIRQTREFFVSNGFGEVVAPYLTDPESAGRYGKPIELRNALGMETSFMRSNLLPGMGRIVGLNDRYSRPDLRLFEVGKAFRQGREDQGAIPGIVEMEELAVVMSGRAEPDAWDMKERNSDLYDLRGLFDRYLARLGMTDVSYRPVDRELWGIGAPALALFVGEKEVGRLGPMDSWIRERNDVKGVPVVALLDLGALAGIPVGVPQYVPPSRFPAVDRDLSFLVDDRVAGADLEATIRKAGGELLRRVRLFDLYQGKNIEKGKKSVTYALVFASDDRTLEDAIVEDRIRAIVQGVTQEHGAALRS